MHTFTLANSIFDGPITNLHSILCILIEILSFAHGKGGKGLNDFKFSTFIGRFQSNGAASIAVKGLKNGREMGGSITPRLAFQHLPPNSATIAYAAEGALFIIAAY